MGETMNGAMRRIVVLIGSLSLVALPLVAAADEGEGTEEESAPTEESQLVYDYDVISRLLLFGFFAPDSEETCTPAEPADPAETSGDGEATATDGDATADLECLSLEIESSGDEVNHGSFLSMLVKAIKAGFDGEFEGDKPLGQYVREFAKSDLGKPDTADKADKGSDDDEGVESDDDDGPGSDKGSKANNGKGKGKKGN
jgi:hypothetical protein